VVGEALQQFARHLDLGAPQPTADVFLAVARTQVEETRVAVRARNARYSTFLNFARQAHADEGQQVAEHPDSNILNCHAQLMNAAFRASLKFKNNDAADVFHAVVPLAVCDFVVLDGRWTEMASQVRCPPRRATIYPCNDRGISSFLDDFQQAAVSSKPDT
jgi:hypothetical protein